MVNNVVILNFSGRKVGNCSAIQECISQHHANSNVRSYHIDREFQTCGNCDYECLKPDASCPNVTVIQREAMNAVCESDITYYIIPNYCGMPSGNYFAINERSVGYFNMNRDLLNQYLTVPKRFIIVSNTESDFFRKAMQQQTNQEIVALYMKTSTYQKRSTAGDMLDSEKAKADLMQFLSNTGL